MPTITMVATANMVSITEQTIFVDIDKRTWTINTDEIEKKIIKKQKQ